MSAIFWVIISSIALILCLLIGFFLWIKIRFKHIVRIKEVVKGRRIIRDDVARDFKDKEGVTWWKLLKERDKEKKLMPLPPPNAIDINFKGKKVVEAYRTESGEYIFLEDRGEVKEMPRDIYAKLPREYNLIKDKDIRDIKIKEWREEKLKEWREKEGVIAGYDPLTTAQRISLVNNIRKAEIRRTKTWKENLPMFVSIGALVLLVVSLMVFWGDIAKPTLDAQQGWLAIETVQKEQLQIIRDIKQGIQTIDAEQDQLNQRVTNLEETPPN